MNKEKMKADKYAGIVTISAVILAVEFSDSPYDIWDLLVGSRNNHTQLTQLSNNVLSISVDCRCSTDHNSHEVLS